MYSVQMNPIFKWKLFIVFVYDVNLCVCVCVLIQSNQLLKPLLNEEKFKRMSDNGPYHATDAQVVTKSIGVSINAVHTLHEFACVVGRL